MARRSLESRVREVEDTLAIMKLQARYGYAVDAFEWDKVAALFAEDAVADFSHAGGFRQPATFRGRAEIAKYFKEWVGPTAVFFAHEVLMPLIELRGDRATGTFYHLSPSMYGPPKARQAVWAHGKFVNDYVRKDGQWYFQHLRFSLNFASPYEQGWHKAGFHADLRDTPGRLPKWYPGAAKPARGKR